MKILKICIISACLLGSALTNTKIYNPETSQERVAPNVFDVCILLDMLGYQNAQNMCYYSYEEEQTKNKIDQPENQQYHILATKTLYNIIHEQEAAIVSTALVRNIFRLAKAWPTSRFPRAIDSLLSQQEWDIYFTDDYQLVVILPKTKYADIIIELPAQQGGGTIIDLEKLGLNYHKLRRFIPDQQTKKRYKDFWACVFYKPDRTTYHETDIKKLSDIFYTGSQPYTVNKRVFLAGHGLNCPGKERIATLKIEQFRELRHALDNANCSLLYIVTCYARENVKLAQTEIFEPTKIFEPTEEYFPKKELSSKRFLEITEGLYGHRIAGTKSGFNTFFSRVDRFFQKEMNFLKNNIMLPGWLNKVSKKIKNNLTEQQMLSGKGTYYGLADNHLASLAKRKPTIERSKHLKRIFGCGFVTKKIENTPFCRFPGAEDFTIVRGVTPHLPTQ